VKFAPHLYIIKIVLSLIDVKLLIHLLTLKYIHLMRETRNGWSDSGPR